MDCPRCHAKEYVKNGLINNLQRFRCKSCNYNYTVVRKMTAADNEKIKTALILYLEGKKLAKIAKGLGVSHVAVLKWVKKYGKNLDQLRKQIDMLKHTTNP